MLLHKPASIDSINVQQDLSLSAYTRIYKFGNVLGLSIKIIFI